jgi:hypothetical protein
MTDITSKTIKDRIVELRRVEARELVSNPRNWRRHPARKSAALRSVLEEVDTLMRSSHAHYPMAV